MTKPVYYRKLWIPLLILLAIACSPGSIKPQTTPSQTAVPPTETTVEPPTETPTATPPKPTATPLALEIQPVSQGDGRPLILAHYMPWYQTPAGSGSWGWHWTMDHFNPRQQDENGRPTIASHYHPLTGPYDSGDQNLLEYQAMLMKLSGIDGVIVDWYGFENFWDYGKINSSTNKLFRQIKDAGLLFAITYEDSTVKNMIENGHPGLDDPLEHGQQVMAYLQENWFEEDRYLKVDGRPVLFVFGNPPYFDSNSDWEVLFSDLPQRPYLITQDGLVVSLAESGYPWPPMHLSGGGELPRGTLENYLDDFYAGASGWDTLVASVFPGFHDIYEQAGVAPSYGYIDSSNGETLAFTFQKAFEYDPEFIQIVTWNDYGEGTNIEPAFEYGYQYLEAIQGIRKTSIDPEFPYTPEDLTLPIQIYELRVEFKGDPWVNAGLDNAVQAVFAGRPDLVRQIIDSFQTD